MAERTLMVANIFRRLLLFCTAGYLTYLLVILVVVVVQAASGTTGVDGLGGAIVGAGIGMLAGVAVGLASAVTVYREQVTRMIIITGLAGLVVTIVALLIQEV